MGQAGAAKPLSTSNADHCRCQLSRSAGEYDAGRQQPFAGGSDLSAQHLENLAHPGFDDLADVEPAQRAAVRLAQHGDADELVGGD